MSDPTATGGQLARIAPNRYAGTSPAEALPEPGSWWRLNAFTADPADAAQVEIAEISARYLGMEWDEGQEMPPHGLILLLTDARYVDGELHSMVLAPHPGWTRQHPVKLTLAQFDLLMSAEPDGAALREAEKARTMGRVQALHEDIGRPTDPEEVARRVEAKRDAEAKKADADRARALSDDRTAGQAPGAPGYAEYSRQVPAALLPSQDIVAAEAAVRHQILVAESTREIIEERIQTASKAMSVVSRYQEEVVATALAGISRQRQQADRMLTSVHTMKLWLGDGVGIHPVLEGQGAPEQEPIRFMQQLLYLDEELHCAQVMEGGFNADDLEDLPRLLSQHPEVVETMLPHPRCVTLARVRRNRREFTMPSSFEQLFAMVDAHQRDQTILIFVRDGERLSIVQADEETSRAQRLFPSRAEIDKIFTSSDWGDRGKAIDVSDVRYAEKRAAHDNVALFYKRFLLILWGAHERAGIFGSLPAGMNWLTGETHDGHFRFIHDEEHGLEGAVCPPVRDWLRGLAAEMRPGSRAVIRWKDFFDAEAAPAAFNNPEHHQRRQIRVPLQDREIVTIADFGGELGAPCLCAKADDWRETGKTYTVNVRLARNAADPRLEGDGLFVMDHMTSAEIEGYLKSRKERRSYIEWMAELKIALPEIRRRECLEEALVNRILAAHPDLDAKVREQLPACAHEAVLAAGWDIPPLSADAGLLAQARVLARGLPEDAEAVSRAVRANGTVLRSLPARPLFDGLIEEPFLRQQVLAPRRDGSFGLRSERLVPEWIAKQPGDIAFGDRPARPKASRSLAFRIPSLADRSWMEGVLANGDAANELLDRVLAPSAEDARAWVAGMIEMNRQKNTRHVIFSGPAPVIGFAVLPPEEHPRRNPDDRWRLRMIRLDLDLVRHAWTAGHRDEALAFARIFARPGRLEELFHERAKTPTARVFLDAPGEARSWRQSAEDDSGPRACAGFRDLTLKAWQFKDALTASFTFDRPDLATALLRPVVEARASAVFDTPKEERAGWFERQRRLRIVLPDGVEDRLLKVIGMFEPLPESPSCIDVRPN